MKLNSREKAKGKLNVVINLSKDISELLNKITLLLLIQRKKMNNIKEEITLKIPTNGRYLNKYTTNYKVLRIRKSKKQCLPTRNLECTLRS